MRQEPLDLLGMARASDPDTSHEAARRAQVRAGTNRARALVAHWIHHAGLTDFELADICHSGQTSIGKRRGELVRLGLVEATTGRRPSPTGSPAVVWRITPDGMTEAERLIEEGVRP